MPEPIAFNSAGINVAPRLSYDGRDAFVTLAQALLPALPAGAPANAGNLTGALNGFIGGGGALPASFQTLYSLPAQTYSATLNQMAGQTGTAAAQSVNHASSVVLGSLLDFSGPGRIEVGTPMSFAKQAQAQAEVCPTRSPTRR
jgi:hypothetical protein